MNQAIKSSRLEGTTLVVETESGTETYDSQFLVAALLVFIAQGGGAIEPEESTKMLELIQAHFHLHGSESLQLLMRAMSEMADKPELGELLTELGQTITDNDKEDIALMALKVIAADGRRQASELEKFNLVVEAIGTPAEVVHRAFDRYFAETMPGSNS
jgi:uncharacterized tellurite resistance protein B-like protein